MLVNLRVQNFAIIEDVSVDFKKGMTVLTGQTGAGKSLIIDSINLLLGARADQEMIRYGEDKAIIEGTFRDLNSKAKETISLYGIKGECLTIYREVSNQSKNIIKINDVFVTLNQLRSLSFYLADIHIQNDTMRLINPENYLFFIDQYDKLRITPIFNSYQMALMEYKGALKKYHDTLAHNKSIIERIDILKYQYTELTAVSLKENEDVELAEKISKMSNYDKIHSNVHQVIEAIGQNSNTLGLIYQAHISLEKIKDFDGKFANYSKILGNSYYDIKEIADGLDIEFRNMDFNPNDLSIAIDRQNEIKRLEKKYQKKLSEIIIYYHDLYRNINMQENYEVLLKEDYEYVKKMYEILVKNANILVEARKTSAIKLTEEFLKECNFLDLMNAKMDIKFIVPSLVDPINASFFTENGIENVDFLISLNLGEPLKSLSKTASGGELSRIMLGLKTVLSRTQNINLIIFDEIDSGISGVTASKIAQKIFDISKTIQVLCITHLPNVASIADHHIVISKKEEKGRTKTFIDYLNLDNRVMEIATMISGERMSENSLTIAKELILKKE